MSPDLAPLVDILLAVNRALQFTAGRDEQSFYADRTIRWATYSQIVIIGEAAARVSRDFRREHPEIPWAEMIGMRHRLVHGYDEINWNRVWETIATDLPELRHSIATLIPQEPLESGEG
jgi:uncharacterized protein with HEPN domain